MMKTKASDVLIYCFREINKSTGEKGIAPFVISSACYLSCPIKILFLK